MAQWVARYPDMADRFRDADGRPPRHTFFFPAEQSRTEHLESLAELARQGYGEVEVHLHHDNDTSDGLRRSLAGFVEQLSATGHLGEDAGTGSKRFAFVHGNWALDNSRPDGRWCGVNDELRVLSECGCFADFTLPSAPDVTQTRCINSIYYATDDPHAPKSHDRGVPVRVGGAPSGDLLIVQGPLNVVWPGGKFGIFPRLEAGNLDGHIPLTAPRIDAWVRSRVCVSGRPDWIFVKVHTHGCVPANREALLGEAALRLHGRLTAKYNNDAPYRLHYVTAREMANIIWAAERGLDGDPGAYRDLVIAPPPLARTTRTEDCE